VFFTVILPTKTWSVKTSAGTSTVTHFASHGDTAVPAVPWARSPAPAKIKIAEAIVTIASSCLRIMCLGVFDFGGNLECGDSSPLWFARGAAFFLFREPTTITTAKCHKLVHTGYVPNPQNRSAAKPKRR